MKHDPRLFGKAHAAGWQLRAKLERRRSARQATIGAGFVAFAAAIATGFAMNAGNEGGAAVLAICATCAAMLTIAAASEA